MKRSIRFPLFAKFFVGCLILAALLIIGGTYVIKDETRLRSRGNFLAKGMRRMQGSVEQGGRAITGTAELLAAYPDLRAALANSPASPPPPPTAPPTPGGPAPARWQGCPPCAAGCAARS